MVDFQRILKPATVTSIGLIMVAASSLLNAPPSVTKVGWGLVIAGSVWFFFKK